MFVLTATATAATTAEVTVGSPHDPFPRNKQNEPAVAIDASRPDVVAAGSNDEIDMAPCGTTIFATDEAPCPFTPGVGSSGVHFSFNGGKTWVQPTYTGWSARNGTPAVGPIGTLPWYYETGLVSDGDPAVAFGPIRENGEFSWANGSRLYYANLTSNFPSGSTPRGQFQRSWTKKRRLSGTWPYVNKALRSRACERHRRHRCLTCRQRGREQLQRQERLEATGDRFADDVEHAVRRQGADLGG
jgi:hypothetical protein